MYVLHHKRFGCSTVYDKDFIRQDESGSFGAKIGKFWMKAADFGHKMEKFRFSAKIS